jgi:hypothetical protein
MISSMGRECTHGSTVKPTVDHGKMEKWMDLANFIGQTVLTTKASMKKI